MENPYLDIINLPHHVSENHPQMSMYNRAAQFAPFAALTGYGAAIEETARYTEEQTELDENRIEEINEQLRYIEEHIGDNLTVSVTYFRQDERKSGGTYVETSGTVKNIDPVNHRLVFSDDRRVRIEDITDIVITNRD